jgi:hypothetical protein
MNARSCDLKHARAQITAEFGREKLIRNSMPVVWPQYHRRQERHNTRIVFRWNVSGAPVHVSRCDRGVGGVVFACEFTHAIDCSRKMCRRIGDNKITYSCDGEHLGVEDLPIHLRSLFLKPICEMSRRQRLPSSVREGAWARDISQT